MTAGELIRMLQLFDADSKVILYADQEGLTTMEPKSVSYQNDYRGNRIVLISAWAPDGDEPL
jgi:hypothetical protein